MLKPVSKKRIRVPGGLFVIVASQYNARFVTGMLKRAAAVFRQAGVRCEVVRVPGAFEIPVTAAVLARRADPPAAIVCLGVILRGETVHAQLIAETATAALLQIQMETEVPVIHEVLLLETTAQAKARCLSRGHNRGEEAARTALEMAGLIGRLREAKNLNKATLGTVEGVTL